MKTIEQINARYEKLSTPERLRVVVETDAPGGDPDDEASLVRFFLYMNEWDVEALIDTRDPDQSRLGLSGKDRIMQYIDDYEKVYANLIIHKSDYPKPDTLRKITKQCYNSTEARNLIISIIDKDDPRPIWYINWGTNDGNTTALKQALDKIQAERNIAEYHNFASKIRYVGAYNQNLLGHHHYSLVFCMDTFYPVMDGGRWYHRWKELTANAGGFDVENDIMNGHGALCANYTIPKEGDTMTFMHLIPNGLHSVQHPQWGNWSGRYSFNSELGLWWCDQQDFYQGTTSRDNTLKRWAAHLQNDFKTRADWCITKRFEDANHEPIPYLQGDASRDVLLIDAHAGENLVLTAEGSNDHDVNSLSYQWIYYPEASTYEGEITIEDSNNVNCIVKIPSDIAEKNIHVILQVTDDGDVPLTRYRRAIISIL